MIQNIIPTEDIKESVIEMMELVKNQVEHTAEALFSFNKDICQEVFIQEKKVNALDSKIDKDSERLMALYSPVAVDLRFIITALNINTFLERIGDNAQGICNYVIDLEHPISEDIVTKSAVKEQFDVILEMFDCVIEAYQNEDNAKASRALSLDKKVDEVNSKALDIIMSAIKEDIDNMRSYLFLFSIIRKAERIGDLIQNLAEETIFYIDAKVLKHKKKKTQKYIDKHSEEDPKNSSK